MHEYVYNRDIIQIRILSDPEANDHSEAAAETAAEIAAESPAKTSAEAPEAVEAARIPNRWNTSNLEATTTGNETSRNIQYTRFSKKGDFLKKSPLMRKLQRAAVSRTGRVWAGSNGCPGQGCHGLHSKGTIAAFNSVVGSFQGSDGITDSNKGHGHSPMAKDRGSR